MDAMIADLRKGWYMVGAYPAIFAEPRPMFTMDIGLLYFSVN